MLLYHLVVIPADLTVQRVYSLTLCLWRCPHSLYLGTLVLTNDFTCSLEADLIFMY